MLSPHVGENIDTDISLSTANFPATKWCNIPIHRWPGPRSIASAIIYFLEEPHPNSAEGNAQH